MAVRTRRSLPTLVSVLLMAALVLPAPPAGADNTAQTLPFSQNWTNTGLITVSDDWSGVPGIVGYLGDEPATATTGVDPQTILVPNATVDVNANQTAPNTFATGGVAEFHITDPAVALNGSGTADYPYISLHLNTTGETNVTVAYNLRDLDGSIDNSIQQVALQYRVGSSGNFTNIPAGYVADATTGPSQATLVTAVSATLPAAAENQSLVEVRVITTNAVGNDEWVGVDDISVATGPVADTAPSVSSTTPADNATGVAVNANIDINFSEPVNVAGAWFDITCGTSGAHTAAVTGGPQSFTLNPDTDFANSETCTVTIVAAQVTDQDTNDPPDNMAADFVFDFTTAAPPPPLTEISAIQGASHLSPLAGTLVSLNGIVTAKSGSGFWVQDPTPDADDSTSEGIFVFTSSASTANVGDDVTVTGTVVEFRAGGAASGNLTTTEISNPGRTVTVNSTGNALPATTIVGTGGRIPPTTVIEDDAGGNVETGGVFDPAQDGIDFWESMEGMRLQMNNARATGPTNQFGEISVIGDDGANAVLETPRGGIVLRPNDFNPERVLLDDVITGPGSMPLVHTGDHFTAPIVGVLDYSFGNFKLLVTSPPTRVDEGLAREVASTPVSGQLSVGTYNVENLSPNDSAAKFNNLANQIVNNLGAPDLLSIEEIQDNDGTVGGTGSPVVDASATWTLLIEAIEAAGGPTYDFRQIDPVDDQEGGVPGGNIRVGFLFRTDRGLSFVDRPGGTSTNSTQATSGPGGLELTFSPGRIDSGNAAWSNPDPTRRSLVGEFMYGGTRIFAIANHLKSKNGDDPLWGRFQPPVQHTQAQRIQQAQVVNDFVDSLLAIDPQAKVLVLGDINDFWFSSTLTTLKGGVLTDLVTLLPDEERYSYVFEGNSQDLDHILVSNPLAPFVDEVNMLHLNAEFHDQISDHDPVHTLIGIPAPSACAPGATAGPNVITGTEGPDHLCGGNGDDVIDGNGGNDVIDGGPGADRLSGDGGDDRVLGRKGADQMTGGSEDDVLQGEQGGDTLDTVDGVGGNDVADGGAGPDACTGDTGDTEISCET